MAHHSKLLLVAATFVLIGGILMIGCARNEVAPNAPGVSENAGDVYVSLPPRGIPADARVLAAAIAAQDRATPGLLRLQGVVGTGTSADAAGNPVVVIYTERPGVAGLPQAIDGHAVRVHVSGKVVAYAGPPGGGTLQMGTSTGNDLECASGTLGCVVIRSGNEYFLSNNHVFARENDASNGERIDAPGRYDGKPRCAQTPQCANLSDFQSINFSGGNNTIDAAIAAPSAGRAYTQVMSSGYDPSSTPVTGAVGMAVKKTGRTSKLTHGTIEAVNVTINVGYSGGGVARFVGQLQMGGSFIRSGDSGSLMVTETGENPVGLCFAGGGGASFANPIGPVLQRFSATVK